jgi:hypothetical protein
LGYVATIFVIEGVLKPLNLSSISFSESSGISNSFLFTSITTVPYSSPITPHIPKYFVNIETLERDSNWCYYTNDAV